jgi:hypothetical protein
LLFASSASGSQVTILPGINHFGVFTETIALRMITEFLDGLRSNNPS